MTRIIAGSAGGRRLRTPPGSATRPTSDRVREALFSALEARDLISGARVLDLYAGSGALGLEAFSRGAARVDLVEADRRVVAVIRENIAVVVGRGGGGGGAGGGGAGGGRGRSADRGPSGAPMSPVAAHALSVATWLARPAPTAYDLVLLDPPYDLTETALAGNLDALVSHGWLAEHALVVVERSSRSPEPTWPTDPPRLSPDKPRRYGETVMWLASAPASPADC